VLKHFEEIPSILFEEEESCNFQIAALSLDHIVYIPITNWF